MPDGGDNSDSVTTAPEPPAALATPSPQPSENRPPAKSFSSQCNTLLSTRQLRRLRTHEEEFANSLAARLTSFLRGELVVKVAEIGMARYERLVEAWTSPCHLGLFKTEPLRGISILRLPMQLGLNLVDKMMGGPGKAADLAGAEMSEIEKALLDQLTQIVLEEWCANWSAVKELKPVALGSETTGEFLQTSPPETDMLTLTLDLKTGDTEGQILLAIPHPAIEPLIRQMTGENSPTSTGAPDKPAPTAVRWNPILNEVKVGLTAELQGLELSAREILNLKPGDVLPLDPDYASSVVVRLGDLPKFSARLGAVAEKWAVELAQPIRS
jgi:flagellar motor switch protein FliM